MIMEINLRAGVALAVTALVFLSACSGAAHQCVLTEQVYKIGDSEVRVLEHSCGMEGYTVFNMHDDEDTAVEAALETIRKHGGRLVELRHTGERLISFRLGGESYRVDPNRIFTDQGLRDTLERYSTFSMPAFNAVKTFASDLLSDYGLMNESLIITAHNNGSDGYSAASYLPGADYENDAAEVHITPGSDPDDFFFVTSPSAYAMLRESGFNVVLQNNDTVTDDGSLSVLAGREGIPYINCEAEHGHLREQVMMLEALWNMGDW